MTGRNHAIVLGAGMGGLLAARVLADHYAAVTVLDRDELVDEARPRRGVPQGGHGHTLLPRGGQILGRFFPGLLEDLVARGVPVARDDPDEIHFEPLGHHFKGVAPGPGLEFYVPSRPMLELCTREHLRRLPNVTINDRCVVNGLRFVAGRVTSVRLTTDEGPQELEADLVVDALGRGSRTPAWLEESGYPRPEETTIKVRGAYSSLQMWIDPCALTEKMVLISATPTRPKGMALFRHEDDMWDVSIFGVGGVKPPAELDGMLEFIADFAPPHVLDALRSAKPLTDPEARTFPASRWRRYDKMREFPEGLVVLGDSVCSLNPTYGQGMTVAAMQASALAATLREGTHDLAHRFFRAAAKPIKATWNFAAVADSSIIGPRAEGVPLPIRAVGRLGPAFFGAVAGDAVLSDRFLEVFTLAKKPASLLSPTVGARLLRRSGTRRTKPSVPKIPGVHRRSVVARGVRFHVTEAGSGTPVIALHGWPQHHYVYRDLLTDPPDGMRIITPDLPGYGWSGPAPHRWSKDDVARDVLALLDELGIGRAVVVGHDWGGWIGYLLALRAPQRVAGLLALNIAHPWQRPTAVLPHLWRFAYQPVVGLAGVPLHRHTDVVHRMLVKAGVPAGEARIFADSYRQPVTARAARDTYRTFVLKEFPALARRPERRRAKIPIRALFGVDDPAIHPSLAAAETARADDYTLERVADCGHFIVDERPDLVRDRLVQFAAEVGAR